MSDTRCSREKQERLRYDAMLALGLERALPIEGLEKVELGENTCVLCGGHESGGRVFSQQCREYWKDEVVCLSLMPHTIATWQSRLDRCTNPNSWKPREVLACLFGRGTPLNLALRTPGTGRLRANHQHDTSCRRCRNMTLVQGLWYTAAVTSCPVGQLFPAGKFCLCNWAIEIATEVCKLPIWMPGKAAFKLNLLCGSADS